MTRAALLVLPLLAACDVAPQPADPPVNLCPAATFLPFVGQPVTAIAGFVLPQPYRVLGPGDPVTEDHSPARLNIRLDAADHIAMVDCG